MYKDDIWYRKLEAAVNEHQDSLTGKQWAKYHIDSLLKIANRVREFSDSCDICRDFQHTLNRLEEELQELPGSKAQRQYQAEQLGEIAKHFAGEHRLAPPGFFVRKWLRVGMVAGLALGFVAMLVVGNLLLVPLGWLAGTGLAALYGMSEDQKFEREHRRI